MEITCYIKRGFGRVDHYPLCETGKKLLTLTSSVCFSKERAETLKELGYTFKEVLKPKGL